jgi:hypothetical protein
MPTKKGAQNSAAIKGKGRNQISQSENQVHSTGIKEEISRQGKKQGGEHQVGKGTREGNFGLSARAACDSLHSSHPAKRPNDNIHDSVSNPLGDEGVRKFMGKQ